MSDLPAYNPQAQCIKCGGDMITTRYHKAPVPPALGSKGPPCTGLPLGEHQCRTCAGCGYAWCETVLTPPRDGMLDSDGKESPDEHQEDSGKRPARPRGGRRPDRQDRGGDELARRRRKGAGEGKR